MHLACEECSKTTQTSLSFPFSFLFTRTLINFVCFFFFLLFIHCMLFHFCLFVCTNTRYSFLSCLALSLVLSLVTLSSDLHEDPGGNGETERQRETQAWRPEPKSAPRVDFPVYSRGEQSKIFLDQSRIHLNFPLHCTIRE